MKNDNVILIIVGLVIIGFIAYQVSPELFTFNFSGIPGLGNTSDTTNTYNQNTQAASDSRAPTGLMATVAPANPVMGAVAGGLITSDGYKYPVTVHAKHIGSNIEQVFSGLLNDQGKFIHAQTINIPGYYSFWANSGAVTSNIASMVVSGAATTSNRESVSKSLSPTAIISVWSDHVGNCGVVANDPVHSISIPLTNTVINAGGYGVVSVDFSSLANGSYEIDCVIAGETASSYGGACWITVGR